MFIIYTTNIRPFQEPSKFFYMLYNIFTKKGGKPPTKEYIALLTYLSVVLLLSSYRCVEGEYPRTSLFDEENAAYKLTQGICYRCTDFDRSFDIIVFLSLFIVELKLTSFIFKNVLLVHVILKTNLTTLEA